MGRREEIPLVSRYLVDSRPNDHSAADQGAAPVVQNDAASTIRPPLGGTVVDHYGNRRPIPGRGQRRNVTGAILVESPQLTPQSRRGCHAHR